MDSWEGIDDKCELYFCPARNCLRCFLSPTALAFHKKQHVLEKQLLTVDTSLGTRQLPDVEKLDGIITSLESVKFETWDACCKGLNSVQGGNASVPPHQQGEIMATAQDHGTAESQVIINHSLKDQESHQQLAALCDTAIQEGESSLPEFQKLSEDGRADMPASYGDIQTSPRRHSHSLPHIVSDRFEKPAHLPEPSLDQPHVVAPSDPACFGGAPQSAVGVPDTGSCVGSICIANEISTGHSVEVRQLHQSASGPASATGHHPDASAHVPVPSTQPIQQQQVQEDDDDNLDEFL